MPSHRHWTRFGSDQSNVSVRTRERRYEADGEALDESFGGISILLGEEFELEPGQEVQIRYERSYWDAVVRDIEPVDRGSRRVGFAWKSPPASTWGPS